MNSCTIFPIILYTFLFILSFTSCGEVPKTDNDVIITNGLIYVQGQPNPYTGLVKDTVNGKIIEYNVLEGKKDGKFKTFYLNGNPEMIGQLKNNLNHGKWIYYFNNGNIESEGFFENDLPHGYWKWYYENGKLKEEGNYVKGKREGRWVLFDVEGKIKETKQFEQNQLNKK